MCAPKAPSPTATAAAQTASNRETAITQANLNMVDQTDAYGNKLSFNQNGSWSDGTPRYSATQTLSPGQQQILNSSQGTQQNLANLAQEQSGRLSGLLSAPLDWSSQQQYLNNFTNQALDRSWDRQSQQFETDLVNRGIRPGSTQYQQQVGDFRNDRSMAYNNANVANFNTAQQSALANRQAPINEILALAGAGQVSSPSFTSTPQTGVAGTDIAGLINGNYQTQSQGYNSMMGGLLGAGAGLLAAPSSSVLGGLFALSDRRAKKGIKRIGTADNGLPIYLYTYAHGGAPQIGFMAQDVQEVNPGAVLEGPDGYLRVNYEEAVR